MLENLSPAAFEEWCKMVVERTYECRVETNGAPGDEGRDLLIYHPEGLVIAECKMYKGTVGRPIVQKLHSALITAGSSHGMILTTGRFSAEAYEYSRRLRERIDLIDGNALAVMAQRVGVPVTGHSGGGFAIPTTPDSEFGPLVMGTIFGPASFRPMRSQAPRIQITRQTNYRGFFVGLFYASGHTPTAVGTQTADWNGHCWISGDGRKWATGPVPGYRDNLPGPQDLAVVSGTTSGAIEVPNIQITDAVQHMRDGLARHLVEHVSYTGKNNVTYMKSIKPGKREIQIDNTMLLYLPEQRLRISGLSEAYEGGLTETKESLIIACSELASCTICGGTVTQRSQAFCGQCHRSVHRGNWIRPESGPCQSCGATLCRRHLRRTGKALTCPQCAPFGAKMPLPRLLVPGLLGLGVTAAAFLHGEVSAGTYQTWDFFVGIIGWIPFGARAWPLGIGRKGNPIEYQKGVPLRLESPVGNAADGDTGDRTLTA